VRYPCATLALLTGCWLVESAPEPSYRTVVLADEPLAYWRVDAGSTEWITADESGNHFDADYSSNVMFGRGGAVANDDNAAVLLVNERIVPPDLDVWGGDFTIEAWVAPHDASSTGGFFSILIWEEFNVNGFRYGWDNRFAPMFWTFQSGGDDTVISTSAMTVDIWHYVVLTKASTRVTIYLDGTEAVAADVASYKVPAPDQDTRCWGSCQGLETNADFDELALYDHALSAAQVARHYDAGTR
jgi:hypothetical protein